MEADVARQLAGSDSRRFVDIQYGSVASAEVEPLDRKIGRLSGLVVRTQPGGATVPVIIVSMKRNGGEVRKILAEHGFREGTLPAPAEAMDEDALEHADARLKQLKTEQAEQGSRITAVVAGQRTQLEQDWRQVRVAELLLSIQGQTSESQHATVFSGWVPFRQKDRVAERSAALPKTRAF